MLSIGTKTSLASEDPNLICLNCINKNLAEEHKIDKNVQREEERRNIERIQKEQEEMIKAERLRELQNRDEWRDTLENAILEKERKAQVERAQEIQQLQDLQEKTAVQEERLRRLNELEARKKEYFRQQIQDQIKENDARRRAPAEEEKDYVPQDDSELIRAEIEREKKIKESYRNEY